MDHQDETTGLRIGTATAADWTVFESWAAGEGWNPGPADGGCFLAQDPDGFFLGRIGGEPVSAVSLVNYGETFSFLGFYLVHPEFRGLGHGYATWQAGLEHAGGRVIGLDGVLDQQDNYRRSGFQLAHRNIRYVGPAVVAASSADGSGSGAGPSSSSGTGTGNSSGSGSGLVLVPAAEVERSAIESYDAARFPAERPVFLDHWLTAPGHIAYAAVADGESRRLRSHPARTGVRQDRAAVRRHPRGRRGAVPCAGRRARGGGGARGRRSTSRWTCPNRTPRPRRWPNATG